MRVTAFIKKHRKWFLIPIGGLVALLVVVVVTAGLVSPRLTPWIEGPAFREEMNRQTSKGLHFDGQYGPIRRTSFSTAESPEFHASGGVKAMKTLDARGISADFNPWGVLLRRWQFDRIHIRTGEVEVQVYEPRPDPEKKRPWYAVFLPDRVYLREVICDDATVKWRLGREPGGIFNTRLRILPYGRDFEYFAEGGTLRSGGFAPDLALRALHLVITKEELELHRMKLRPKNSDQGHLEIAGRMGMRKDRSVRFEADFEELPLAGWLPASVRDSIRGHATGSIRWTGPDSRLEGSSGRGLLEITGGRLSDLAALEFLASATMDPAFKSLDLTTCTLEVRWEHPRLEITGLRIESKGEVAIEGTVTVDGGRLSGTLELGLAPRSLAWLPAEGREIFSRRARGLAWTTVELSGTLAEPRDDLSPRLAAELKSHPGAALGLFFRSLGEWIEQKAKGR